MILLFAGLAGLLISLMARMISRGDAIYLFLTKLFAVLTIAILGFMAAAFLPGVGNKLPVPNLFVGLIVLFGALPFMLGWLVGWPLGALFQNSIDMAKSEKASKVE